MPAATSPSKVNPSNNSAATRERYAFCGSMSMTNTMLRIRVVPPYTVFHPANDDEALRDAGGRWVGGQGMFHSTSKGGSNNVCGIKLWTIL